MDGPVRPIQGALLLLALAFAGTARAQLTPAEQTAFNERCATRLSSALLGKAPTAALLADAAPQSKVDGMLASPDFIEKFARFVNASFNAEPGDEPAHDAAYYLSKYVLTNNRPWRELFAGPYRVDRGASVTADAVVVQDANGLGYFRSRPWMVRYAGNELDGYRIVAAYRIMNNIIGLKLLAAVNTDGVNAAGRMAAECAGCHYNQTFALDYAAKILSRRVGSGDTMTFAAPNEGPQKFLGGLTIADDKQFVTALVDSPNFKFRTCRLAMEFLYGRPEFKCEGPVFDKCMASFAAAGTVQSALSSIAKDASFCQ